MRPRQVTCARGGINEDPERTTERGAKEKRKTQGGGGEGKRED